MSILLGEPLVPLLVYTMVRAIVDATEIIRYVESGLTGSSKRCPNVWFNA